MLVWAFASSPSAGAGQARDPHLEWRTIRSEHFEIHYHEPLGVIARRVAAVAERAHSTLAPILRHWPDERTQVVLSDNSDSANGSAGAIPRNHIRLFASGPEDLTPLGDYDDWLTELVVHEHTHILHLDTIHGIPEIINAIFGKVYPPNAVQPRWFLEGYAVYQESEHTSAGRLRSSVFDMFIRMDALAGKLLDLAQISNGVDRWPHGNIWYLYGSRFIQFIAERYGQEALTTISHEYGGQLIPYGMNRVARRATGQSYVELYEEFRAHVVDQAGGVADEVRQRGLAAGTRITFHGENGRSPRFLDADRVAYWVSADDRSQIRAIDARTGRDAEEIVRAPGVTYLSPSPNGRDIYYGSPDYHRDIYYFYDLFRYDLETGRRERLTEGMRAQEPDVAPDGRRVAFTINGASTTHLAVADLRDIAGTKRILVRNPRFEQVYTPRWSPDGQTIAYSTWKDGGYRDIHLVDVDSGRVVEVTHDRALDMSPAWSPDGRTLYFSSDRTGISNIYAFDTVTGRTMQVTNVVGGAFQPAISPDGSRMVYLGYSHLGYDLWSMELDPAGFRPAPAYVDVRPAPVDTEAHAVLESEAYEPLETLLPRAYMLELGQDAFGPQLAVTFQGQDAVGFHNYAARIGVGLERANVNADLAWVYQRSVAPIRLRLFRAVSPRGGLFVGGERRRWIEEAVGGEVGVSYDLPAALHFERMSLTYSLTDLQKGAAFGGRLDPNDPPPSLPQTGLLASLRAGWSWSDTRGTAWDVTTSEGRALSFNVSVAHPYLASQFTSVSANWTLTQFFENPFVQHQVLAVRYAGGLSGGDLGRRGVFGVGGFPDTNVIDQLVDSAPIGGVALRGYPPFDRTGTQFHLVQAEYRFPIYRFMAGVATLPAYLSRVWGSVFFDYGDAFFGRFDIDTFRAGVGGELLFDFTLGYVLPYTLRLGLARGLSEGGQTSFYMNIGRPF